MSLQESVGNVLHAAMRRQSADFATGRSNAPPVAQLRFWFPMTSIEHRSALVTCHAINLWGRPSNFRLQERFSGMSLKSFGMWLGQIGRLWPSQLRFSQGGSTTISNSFRSEHLQEIPRFDEKIVWFIWFAVVHSSLDPIPWHETSHGPGLPLCRARRRHERPRNERMAGEDGSRAWDHQLSAGIWWYMCSYNSIYSICLFCFLGVKNANTQMNRQI